MAIDSFSFFYPKLGSETSHLIFNADISPVAAEEIPRLATLKHLASKGKRLKSKLVMIALNGGLGTRMGLSSPKSLLPVNGTRTFLDRILAHATRQQIQLVLMSSFWTQAATRHALTRRRSASVLQSFVQHKFPKISQSDLMPAQWPANPVLEWNPPGHGDIYSALSTSGMLSRLISSGKRYAYVFNVDNLGAGIEWSLLGHMAQNQIPFLMEVAERSPTDLKGGHIARNRSGRLMLREIAQCPEEEKAAFADTEQYRFFNTNNIWIDLRHLHGYLKRHGSVPLPLIRNPKTIDPRDAQTPLVWQIETAMGAALSSFKDAGVVRVPTTRHYPVKTCADLLAARSDCFILNPHDHLRRHPLRQGRRVKIHLDPVYYSRLDQLEKRFRGGAPSLLGCRSLTIKGDVFFLTVLQPFAVMWSLKTSV